MPGRHVRVSRCSAAHGLTCSSVAHPYRDRIASCRCLATNMSASAPAFRPVVKADGPRPGSGGRVLLLEVLVQDRDGRSAGRAGEVRPGPQPSRPPVVPAQVRELLPQPAGRHPLEASGQPRQRAEPHRQVHALGLAVELDQPGPGVRAHVPHDLLRALRMPRGEHPVPGDEHQVGARDEHAVPASADVLY